MRRGDRLLRVWSAEARQDLLDIWAFIASDSVAAADKQLHEIDRACFALGAWPEYGKAREEVREGLRSIVVARYVVFYRVMKTTLQIVRVLDERRDVDAIFGEGD